MQRIGITPKYDKIAQHYRDALMGHAIWVEIMASLEELISDITQEDSNYRDYIGWIKDNLAELLTKHPTEFDGIEQRLQDLFDCKMDWHGWVSGSEVSFGTRVARALHYSDVREKILPEYIKELGIRTCVYCNMQYALTIPKRSGKNLAYYEMDHAWPKSKFPYLALSFFNLHPCCGPCNKHKSAFENEPHYSIYIEKAEPAIKFSIDDESLVEYILMHDRTKLKICMQHNDEVKALYKKLRIASLYTLHTDEVEEMAWKAKIYNDAYFRQLSAAYGTSFLNSRTNLYRMLYGLYNGEENIYSRPLTKMKQDIAKQLKLI